MEAWGGGLYDSDFALDLKATIKGVLRAPLGEDDLLAEIKAFIGEGIEGADTVDYWLVLADQFERCGMPRRDIFERAIAIVETGEDVALLEQLGTDLRTIAERRKETANLVERLRAPRAAKPRKPLKKPQPLLLEHGEALAWPTDRGDAINPYVAENMLWKLGGFTQDGWGFAIVTDVGHQFHVLAFYAVQVLMWRRTERPSPELAVHCPRSSHLYGTTGKLHLERARVERLSQVPEEAMGPPPKPDYARRESRRVTIADVGLSSAFGYDAWNHFVIPAEVRLPCTLGNATRPDEPDQRSDPHDRREEHDLA